MKISKEKMIKLFEDGLSKIRIDEGAVGSLAISDGLYDGHGIEMSYHLQSDEYYQSIGYMRLYSTMNSKESFKKLGTDEQWQYCGIKYILTFTVHSDISKHTYPSVLSSNKYNPMDVDDDTFMCELTNEEFTKLASKFKIMLSRAETYNNNLRSADINRKLEKVSDDFGLDFFPKTRNVIFEKTKIIPKEGMLKAVGVWTA